MARDWPICRVCAVSAEAGYVMGDPTRGIKRPRDDDGDQESQKRHHLDSETKHGPGPVHDEYVGDIPGEIWEMFAGYFDIADLASSMQVSKKAHEHGRRLMKQQLPALLETATRSQIYQLWHHAPTRNFFTEGDGALDLEALLGEVSELTAHEGMALVVRSQRALEKAVRGRRAGNFGNTIVLRGQGALIPVTNPGVFTIPDDTGTYRIEARGPGVTVTITSGVTVHAYDNAWVNMTGPGWVYAHDSAQVVSSDGIVNADGDSRVLATGGRVIAYGSAGVLCRGATAYLNAASWALFSYGTAHGLEGARIFRYGAEGTVDHEDIDLVIAVPPGAHIPGDAEFLEGAGGTEGAGAATAHVVGLQADNQDLPADEMGDDEDVADAPLPGEGPEGDMDDVG